MRFADSASCRESWNFQEQMRILVLDGLERVLVAYHRHDAAQMLDSEAGIAEDKIAGRDTCAAIGALDVQGRRLLHLLSLLQGAVDFPTLEALAIAPSSVSAPNHSDGSVTGILNANDLGVVNRKLGDTLWGVLEHLGRDWRRGVYRPGEAEAERTLDLLNRGELTEEVLAKAEELAERGNSIWVRQNLREIRGEWYLARKEHARAIDCFSDALTWCRERSVENHQCEARLILARLRAGEHGQEADIERLSALCGESDTLATAELWQELGERDKAIEHARRAYLWAARQQPRVPLPYLNDAAAVLRSHDAELPAFPRVDHGGVRVFPWEEDVRSYTDRLKQNSAG